MEEAVEVLLPKDLEGLEEREEGMEQPQTRGGRHVLGARLRLLGESILYLRRRRGRRRRSTVAAGGHETSSIEREVRQLYVPLRINSQPKICIKY